MSIGITWTGWDGSQWDLRTGDVRLTNGGIEGLMSFKFDSFTTDSAARDGQRFQGWRAGPRSVLLPVLLGRGDMTELDWLATERAWWRTMRPGQYGTLTVTGPDGGVRQIKLRFVDDGGHAHAIDPTRKKLTGYALNMIADDPYFYGPNPWSLTFAPSAEQPSFFSTGSVFGIASSFTADGATLTNPGDVDAYPVYELAGPLTAFKITNDKAVLSGNITVGATQKLVIDNSPVMQTAYLYNANGTYTNVLPQLTSFGFGSIKPGTDIKLGVLLTGTGTLTVSGQPRYFKAW